MIIEEMSIMNKKIAIFLMILSFLFANTTFAFAAMDNSLHIVVGTEYFNTNYIIAETGRVLVPVRALAQELGFDVDWVASTRTIVIKKGADTVKITLGSNITDVNSRQVTMDVFPRVFKDVTFVPLRFISEALGMNVTYKKLNETPMVWITRFNLLADDDVKINDNYTCIYDAGPPVYRLKETGETARHIHVGDSLEKVMETYGVPFDEGLNNDHTGKIRYITVFLPHTDAVQFMGFTFEKGVLKEVTIG